MRLDAHSSSWPHRASPVMRAIPAGVDTDPKGRPGAHDIPPALWTGHADAVAEARYSFGQELNV